MKTAESLLLKVYTFIFTSLLSVDWCSLTMTAPYRFHIKKILVQAQPTY